MINKNIGRIIEESNEGGDCTSYGTFRLFNDKTSLKEILDNLDKEEWGNIKISFRIKYSKGKIYFPKEFNYLLDKKIHSCIYFHGGWTNMNYQIDLHNDND